MLVYMDINNWKKGPIRLKTLHKTHTSSGRFWSGMVLLEISSIPKERGGLCRSLFRMAPMYTPIRIHLPGWGRIMATVLVRYVSVTRLRLWGSPWFSSKQKIWQEGSIANTALTDTALEGRRFKHKGRKECTSWRRACTASSSTTISRKLDNLADANDLLWLSAWCTYTHVMIGSLYSVSM